MRNQTVRLTAFLLAGSVWADQIVLNDGDLYYGRGVVPSGETTS